MTKKLIQVTLNSLMKLNSLFKLKLYIGNLFYQEIVLYYRAVNTVKYVAKSTKLCLYKNSSECEFDTKEVTSSTYHEMCKSKAKFDNN